MLTDIIQAPTSAAQTDASPIDCDVTTGPLVVFIAGAGRSGSTLLGDALAQMPGCFHAGELRFALEQFGNDDRICGCGHPLHDCDSWRAIHSHAFDNATQIDLDDVARFSATELSYRPRWWFKLRRQARASAPVGSSAEQYTLALRQLYLAIAAVTEAKVIIDSSKAAMHVYLGMRFTGLRTHVIHLIRDPRAIAYSWRRRNIDDVITYGPARVSINWVASNLAVGALNNYPVTESHYTRIRYEDFIQNPRHTLEAVTSQLDIRFSSSSFVDPTTLHMEPNHTVAGNPSRFTRGNVKLKPDDEWRLSMRTRDRALATVPAATLLRRYSYPVRTRPYTLSKSDAPNPVNP